MNEKQIRQIVREEIRAVLRERDTELFRAWREAFEEHFPPGWDTKTNTDDPDDPKVPFGSYQGMRLSKVVSYGETGKRWLKWALAVDDRGFTPEFKAQAQRCLDQLNEQEAA